MNREREHMQRQRGFLRFVKWKRTKSGMPVSRCLSMRRTKVRVEGVKMPTYRFRCRICPQWVFPYDYPDTTTELAPLEVRIHVQLHHPDKRWSRKWGSQRKVRPGEECPACGFDQLAWRLQPTAVLQEGEE